jgi:hypothetical protein
MPVSPSTLVDLVARLVDRGSARTEADIQAEVRQLFLTAPFQLEEDDVRSVLLESPLGDRRRIDVELGSTVVEVKRSAPRQGQSRSPRAARRLCGGQNRKNWPPLCWHADRRRRLALLQSRSGRAARSFRRHCQRKERRN